MHSWRPKMNIETATWNYCKKSAQKLSIEKSSVLNLISFVKFVNLFFRRLWW